MIRQATPDDIEALVELLRALFSIEVDFDCAPEKQRSGLRLMLDTPETRPIFLAEIEGQVVGMGTLQVLISTAQGGPVGLVEDMVVKEEWRGQGFGKEILSAIEDWSRQHGLTRLQLLADSENTPALKFYDTQGWTRTQLVARRKVLD